MAMQRVRRLASHPASTSIIALVIHGQALTDGEHKMTEGSHGVETLRSKTTLREILEVATGFEASARDFYKALTPKVSKRIRYLVEELAAEEQQHFDLFHTLAQRDDLAEQVKIEIERTASDSKFSDCLHLPNLGENPDDQAVLQYAMGREHAAMSHYGELAETTPPGPIRELFQYLASEETKHKLELEKLYYEIVHRGGGV
jgi:rubrerythrin